MTAVQLPAAPGNAPPVPHLTSIYGASCRGEYGSHKCPEDCGGCLIRDLLT